jgi:hypothetical protein
MLNDEERLKGLRSHILALNLAIKETLTPAELQQYGEYFKDWVAKYFVDEELKRVWLYLQL